MMAEACIAVNEIDPGRYHSFVSTLFEQYKERFTDEETLEKSKKQLSDVVANILSNPLMNTCHFGVKAVFH